MAEISLITLDDQLSDQWTAAGRTAADLADDTMSIQDQNYERHATNLFTLLGSPYTFIRARAASNLLIDVGTLQRYLDDRVDRVFVAAASNPRTNHQMRDFIYGSNRTTDAVLTAMAALDNLRQQDQNYLSSPLRSVATRLAMASNTTATEQTLIQLCEFQTVAMNTQILARAAAEGDAMVRANIEFAANSARNPILPNPA